MPPANITLPRAERVTQEGKQGGWCERGNSLSSGVNLDVAGESRRTAVLAENHVRSAILLFAVPDCSETLTLGTLIGGFVMECATIGWQRGSRTCGGQAA